MNDNLGTLAGLISDLEEQHPHSIDLGGEEFCGSCWRPSEAFPGDQERQPWPCPTIDLVRRHKRAQYWIAYYPKEGLHSVHSGHGFDKDWHYSGKTREEAEAWVDRQVNSE